ncbi:hypothetical protein EYF80_038158 [Liparis tanakae]|uniref:Uncharacterized protein n=1 Tax=Liparis tanakae TaxID=230148 RepID=A0A4Z2GG49_9TELE|nr:hypothetical protein EYF80_038158 [Liparis tanakae]
MFSFSTPAHCGGPTPPQTEREERNICKSLANANSGDKGASSSCCSALPAGCAAVAGIMPPDFHMACWIKPSDEYMCLQKDFSLLPDSLVKACCAF